MLAEAGLRSLELTALLSFEIPGLQETQDQGVLGVGQSVGTRRIRNEPLIWLVVQMTQGHLYRVTLPSSGRLEPRAPRSGTRGTLSALDTSVTTEGSEVAPSFKGTGPTYSNEAMLGCSSPYALMLSHTKLPSLGQGWMVASSGQRGQASDSSSADPSCSES